MDRDAWARADRILDAVLDEVEDRGASLEEAAAALLADESEAVRRIVEERLPFLAAEDDPLGGGVGVVAPDLAAAVDGAGPAASASRGGATEGWAEGGTAPAVGEQVGAYRLVRVLGRGGMGIVYLAERADREFEKQVAIKLLATPVATAAERARFLRERQFLADLEHPSIARLIDGGVTAGGAPYLVLEAVEGEPIDRWCERRRATVEERLSLFLAVCDAVQAAHQRLIVHRDLKPANILVTADGRPKLLDFGIAGLVELADDDPAAATRTLLRACTPDYASPEQLRGERTGIPSDVYSLGVLLYRLLTGRLPHPPRQDRRGPTSSDDRTDPPPPSRAALDARDGSGRERQHRARRLRGDLDNIVLKAIEDRPERRYDSVGELARDLRRHLEGLPVEARASTVGYRARKFVRRHRVAVAAAAAVAASLLVALVLTTVQAERAERQRLLAEREAAKAATVSGFLTELFTAADPYTGAGEIPSVHDLLAHAERRLGERLDDQPEVRGELLGALSRARLGLGDREAAARLADEALALQRELLDEADPRLAGTLVDAARARAARGDLDGARERFDEALALLRPGTASDGALVAEALVGLARIESDDDAKEERYRRALEALSGPERSPETATATATDIATQTATAEILHELGMIEERRGRLDAAEALKVRSLRMTEELLGAQHPMVFQMTSNLAILNLLQGDLDDAERLYRAAIAGLESRLGPDHPDLADALTNLGHLLLEQGRPEEAAPHVERALELASARPDPGYRTTAYQVNLGTLRREQGRFSEALTLHRDAARFFRAELGPEHPAAARVDSLVALDLRLLGRLDQAEPLLRRALALQTAAQPDDHPHLAETRAGLGGLVCERGDPAGLRLVEAACDPRAVPRGALRAAICRVERAACRAAAGDEHGAARLRAEAEELLRALPGDHYLWARLTDAGESGVEVAGR